MTPEEIKNRHNAFFDAFSAPYSRKESIEAAKADAIYEVALQLAEMNQRERDKKHDYNIPGVDGVPPARRKGDGAIQPTVPFEPLEPLETKPTNS